MHSDLAEFSAYYSNRMSYDEVAGLLERVTGQPILSDQTIQHLVVAKAVEVSQQWQSQSQTDTAAPPGSEVMPQVDWYDPQSEEVLLLTDAIQVKQQGCRSHIPTTSLERVDQICTRRIAALQSQVTRESVFFTSINLC